MEGMILCFSARNVPRADVSCIRNEGAGQEALSCMKEARAAAIAVKKDTLDWLDEYLGPVK